MQNYWWLPRRARWLWLGFVLSAAANAAAGAAPSAGTARACLFFEREEADKALLYHARNACQRSLDCRMTYRLNCQDLDGKDESTSDREFAFDIGAKSTETALLSAEACQHGWTISDVTWDCV